MLNTVYSIAKTGVIMLSKMPARQYARDNLRVNIICPGYHDTGLTPPEEGAALEVELIPRIPPKRGTHADEIKRVAVWLASKASSYVTGQIITQDGSATA